VGISEAPPKIPVEICKPTEKGLVVVRTAKMLKGRSFLLQKFPKPELPRAFFLDHVTRETEKKKNWRGKAVKVVRYVGRFNLYWSEALKAGETEPKMSWALENALFADDAKQHVNSVAKLRFAIFTPEMLRAMLVVFGISIPFGLLMDTLLNLIPAYVVHWVP